MTEIKPKKRNLQDATLRNIRAIKTKLKALEVRVKVLEKSKRKI